MTSVRGVRWHRSERADVAGLGEGTGGFGDGGWHESRGSPWKKTGERLHDPLAGRIFRKWRK